MQAKRSAAGRRLVWLCSHVDRSLRQLLTNHVVLTHCIIPRIIHHPAAVVSTCHNSRRRVSRRRCPASLNLVRRHHRTLAVEASSRAPCMAISIHMTCQPFMQHRCFLINSRPCVRHCLCRLSHRCIGRPSRPFMQCLPPRRQQHHHHCLALRLRLRVCSHLITLHMVRTQQHRSQCGTNLETLGTAILLRLAL